MPPPPPLSELITALDPVLQAEGYVFCSFPAARYGDHRELQPVAAVREAEGLTLVIPRARADEQHLAYDSVFRLITLQVCSSLEAVGLTAAFSACLTAHGISANVLAGFHHDHVLVQAAEAERALAALQSLARSARRAT
jgi:uncharacterized protein